MALAESGVRLVAEGADTFNSSLERAERSVQQFGREAGNAGGGLEMMTVKTVALGTALGNLATQALGAATNAIRNFISTGFEYNKTLENAEAQLLAFTGSQEEAARVLAMVERRAALTPFAFDEMATSAAGLQAVANSTGISLEELLETAEILAASNPAEGLEGAAFALREFFSGDMISLQDRFNLPKDMLKRVKEGGMSLADLRAEMDNLGLSTDLVTNLAGTFDGRMSTLIDTVTRLAGAFTQPIFDAFSGILGDIQVGLDGNIEAWTVWAQGVGQTVADAFITAKQAWQGQWEDNAIIQPVHRMVGNVTLAIKQMWDNIGVIMTAAKPVIAGMWDELAIQVGSLQKAWQPLNNLFKSAVTLIQELVGFGSDLANAMFGVHTETSEVNKQMGAAYTLGETLGGMFDRLAGFVNRVIIKVQELRRQFEYMLSVWGNWYEALISMASNNLGIPQMLGGSPPPANAPAGNTPEGWGDTPDTQPGGVIVPIPPPPSPKVIKGGTNVNVSVNVTGNMSPTTATKVVSDGVTAAMRSQGLA